MKAFRDSRVIHSLLTSVLMATSGQRQAPAAQPQEKNPVPLVQEAGWAPGPVWTFWGKEKSLVLVGFGTPEKPGRSLVTVPN
jgi:hypothetical protein